ncbi:MAG: S-layer protein [Candidatus Altiarchaeota archaeon]|nr:S-layer protein [Candidatus Altiarchaeota archaeon]
MKSIDIKRIGSVVAGTAMLGAALSAPVIAGLDSAGLDKGFFYDANFNPKVQIVVGEKVGNAMDFVAAGNIAATIGNLAYMTKTVTPTGPTYVPEGQVVITTAARGAVGDYVQDTDKDMYQFPGDTVEDFYKKGDGLYFDNPSVGDPREYERGDFTSYTLACDKQTRTDAGLLMEGTYDNVHCLFCQNLCMEALENPAHTMKEKIIIDSEGIHYYEAGIGNDDSESLKMDIDKGSVVYTVETDYIPMKRITEQLIGGDADDYLDFEYRGKMILFGDDDYYVKDIDGVSKITLCKGKVLEDVTNEGFTAEYNGYKFKIDHLIFAEEFKVAGILLDVEKPDGTTVGVQISKMANSPPIDGKLEVAGIYAEESAPLQTASIIVYDLDSEVILEDSEDLELGGEVKKDWEVEFTVVNTCTGTADCDIDEYDTMDPATTNALLEEITITYNHDLDGDEALEKDESLMFPNNFRLTYKGYMTNDYKESPCSGAGEGDIKVDKGDSAYQLVLSLTGEDGNRYDEVRLDEGPFKKNDLFMVNGVVYKYDKYEDEEGNTDAEDEMEITLDPVIRGSRKKITLQRYCDPDDDGNVATTYTGMNCAAVGGDIILRTLALTDALDDDGSGDYENDDEIDLDPYDLFIKDTAIPVAGGATVDMIFDDGGNTILFATHIDPDPTSATNDFLLTVNADMVGTFDDFDVDDYSLEMNVVTEAGLTTDVNDAVDTTAIDDLNNDGDDDDILVIFETDDGDVVIDISDRNYDENIKYDFDTSVALYDPIFDTTAPATNVINLVGNAELDEDVDTLLITPNGGDEFTIDWGSDNRVDAVDVCHPVDEVDSTYFIGTVEEETVSESIITKADEGKEVSAGCCTFTVSKFEVTAGGGATETVTVSEPVQLVGNMVVPEVAADTSMNLILVGGPAVNAMTETAGVSKDEIDKASNHYVVKKIGNKVVVAGWTADDTVAAGTALINWLKVNVHA